MQPPKGFLHCFSSEVGEVLFQTNFLAVATSVGHLSREGAGGG